jgi:hypothetical protein
VSSKQKYYLVQDKKSGEETNFYGEEMLGKIDKWVEALQKLQDSVVTYRKEPK